MIQSHLEGCVLLVRAQPSARRNGIVGKQAGALKVAVTAPAQDGRANAALVEVLAKQLGIRRSQIELAAGPTSREKRFLIRGTGPAEIARRVAKILNG